MIPNLHTVEFHLKEPSILIWSYLTQRKGFQVPAEVIEEIETVTAADELEARKKRDAQEVADFITRQVLERGANFFDG